MHKAMIHETEDQTRLRRAKEALAQYRQREDEARKALAAAVESTKRAKEKYEEMYLAEEKREVERLKASYLHCTK